MEGSTGPGPMGGLSQSPGKLTVEQVKTMRVELDRILKVVMASDFVRAKDQVIIKLKESRHWLGEYLKELGNELPAEYSDLS